MSINELQLLSQQYPIVIFDGECILCNNTIQFVINHDTARAMRFMTLQSAFQLSLIDPDTSPDSIVVLHKSKGYYRANAIEIILRHLPGWPRYLGYILSVIPGVIANPIYEFVAKNRYRIWGKRDVCMMPPPEWKDIFLG
jgi:predicted DCC family thiol-disulfide oxidoreductase YuxK